MSKIYNEVKQILAENTQSRDSDKELIRAYFRSKGVVFTPEQERVLFSVSMESLTRARRKIQEQGLYPAKEGVRKVRGMKEKIIRQTSKQISPDEIIEASPQQLFDDKNLRGFNW